MPLAFRRRADDDGIVRGVERRMNRIVRRRMEMAGRVLEFSRAHPSPDASYASLVAHFEERMGRLDALVMQELRGVDRRHGSVVRRRELRRRIHDQLLRHLVTVAHVAAREESRLAGRFVMPQGNENSEAFRTLARKMLEQGQAEGEVLAKHGLADSLLADLEAALDGFDGSVEDSHLGRMDHVGARAEMKRVSDEVMALVELLDGLNRYRFSGHPELLAGWRSARHVVAGGRGGSDGDVKPAA
jgi:hypothetical protein